MERRERKRPGSSRIEYEAFLSFRGPDTRHTFTDCLYQDMIGAGIRVFRDDDELRVGESIKEELNRAIDCCGIYIPIFSKTYASSKWCLIELARMLECASRSNGKKKEILPIFFDVAPDDVKLKTSLYRDALTEHEKNFSADQVKGWRDALVQVNELKGWELKNYGGRCGELIKLVTQEVLVKLNMKYKNVTEQLVEDDDQVDAVMRLLDVESEGARLIALHGMGGIGKTTLAKVIYNKLSSHFKASAFLEDVRESSQRYGLVSLQKQLLSSVVDSRFTDQIANTDEGIDMIKRAVCGKKVLIILDDLGEDEQLKKLVGKYEWFCSGSRIIVTTRDLSVLTTEIGTLSDFKLKEQPDMILLYEVREMKFDPALQLFCRHAFRKDYPEEDYDDISREIISTLGKLPLAIEVIGSFLSSKCKDLWEDTLMKLRKVPPKKIRETLMISYETLEYEQKEVFLDIACFFIEEDQTYPIFMWREREYYPHEAVRILQLRSLIKIREGTMFGVHDRVQDRNVFWMHDQVRDFGRYIIREENPKCPGKFSRTWALEDALNVLESKEMNKDVEALSLSQYSFTTQQLVGLPNLRFLRGKGANFVGDFKNLLSNLIWLCWHGCPRVFEGTNFHLISLVVLELSESDITEEWGGWSQIKMAKRLKVLDLRSCSCLKKTPDLSDFVSLEVLIFASCVGLMEIHCSIGKLNKLNTLDCGGCNSLNELPEEIGTLNSLTTFNMRGCNMEKLPRSIGKLEWLVEFDLSNSGIINLPDSIGGLKRLKILRMENVAVRVMPSAIGLMEMLEELHANDCYDLGGEIPAEIGKLSHLRLLDLSFTHISGLPATIISLSNLRILKLMGCSSLDRLPKLPPSLTHLTLESCFGEFVPDLSNLVILESMTLGSWSSLVGMNENRGPFRFPCLQQLGKLRNLEINGCPIPKGILDLSGLKNLESLKLIELLDLEEIHGLQDLESLRHVRIEKCHYIRRLPDLSKLRRLRNAEILGCKMLRHIEGPERLESLRHLRVEGCESLERLPEVLESVKLDVDRWTLHCTENRGPGLREGGGGVLELPLVVGEDMELLAEEREEESWSNHWSWERQRAYLEELRSRESRREVVMRRRRSRRRRRVWSPWC